MIKLFKLNELDVHNHWKFKEENGNKSVFCKVGGRPFYMPFSYNKVSLDGYEDKDFYPNYCEIAVNGRGNKIIKPCTSYKFDDMLFFVSTTHLLEDEKDMFHISHGLETVDKRRFLAGNVVYSNFIFKGSIPTAMYFIIKKDELKVVSWNGVHVFKGSRYYNLIAKESSNMHKVHKFKGAFLNQIKAQCFTLPYSFKDIRKEANEIAKQPKQYA